MLFNWRSLEIAPMLLPLNQEVRAKTVRLTYTAADVGKYVPWLALRPLTSGPINSGPLLTTYFAPGSLIVDRCYLQIVADFLAGEGREIGTSLGPERDEILNIYIDIAANLSCYGELFGKATHFLEKAMLGETFGEVVDMVLPLKRQHVTGVSSHYARGAIFIGFFRGLTIG
jgi:hypothetical protein